MKIKRTYSHKNAFEILESKNVYSEIKDVLTDDSIILGKIKPNNLKKIINNKFSDQGWADRIKLQNTKLTISYMKTKVGLCFQIGNVARTYADLLKLSYLIKQKIIQCGIIVVPMQNESILMGKNYARFERLNNEIKIFDEIINVPIYLIGISN